MKSGNDWPFFLLSNSAEDLIWDRGLQDRVKRKGVLLPELKSWRLKLVVCSSSPSSSPWLLLLDPLLRAIFQTDPLKNAENDCCLVEAVFWWDGGKCELTDRHVAFPVTTFGVAAVANVRFALTQTKYSIFVGTDTKFIILRLQHFHQRATGPISTFWQLIVTQQTFI